MSVTSQRQQNRKFLDKFAESDLIRDTIDRQTNGYCSVSKSTTVNSLSSFIILTFTALHRMEQKPLLTGSPYGAVTTQPVYMTVSIDY